MNSGLSARTASQSAVNAASSSTGTAPVAADQLPHRCQPGVGEQVRHRRVRAVAESELGGVGQVADHPAGRVGGVEQHQPAQPGGLGLLLAGRRVEHGQADGGALVDQRRVADRPDGRPRSSSIRSAIVPKSQRVAPVRVSRPAAAESARLTWAAMRLLQGSQVLAGGQRPRRRCDRGTTSKVIRRWSRHGGQIPRAPARSAHRSGSAGPGRGRPAAARTDRPDAGPASRAPGWRTRAPAPGSGGPPWAATGSARWPVRAATPGPAS